ncbi:MAG: hypothetical protein LUO94_11345 [Methylococcaceae bacterium]|nr:hypothetical protein [Methylococcaceae bacterium]
MKSAGRVTTAWADSCSCNTCILHIHVDYAGGMTPRIQERRSDVPSDRATWLFIPL